MANKKKQKYPSQSKMKSDARRYVIKTGEYNGGSDSDAFMVSGHSTGSPYSEMEELSEQLTRDVGGYDYQEPEYASDAGVTGYELNQGEGLGDLGGPELYGQKAALLKKSPIAHAATSRVLGIGAAVGLAATAVLGGLAYAFYRKSSTSAEAPRRHRATGAKAKRSVASATATKRGRTLKGASATTAAKSATAKSASLKTAASKTARAHSAKSNASSKSFTKSSRASSARTH